MPGSGHPPNMEELGHDISTVPNCDAEKPVSADFPKKEPLWGMSDGKGGHKRRTPSHLWGQRRAYHETRLYSRPLLQQEISNAGLTNEIKRNAGSSDRSRPVDIKVETGKMEKTFTSMLPL